MYKLMDLVTRGIILLAFCALAGCNKQPPVQAKQEQGPIPINTPAS